MHPPWHTFLIFFYSSTGCVKVDCSPKNLHLALSLAHPKNRDVMLSKVLGVIWHHGVSHLEVQEQPCYPVHSDICHDCESIPGVREIKCRSHS